MAAAHIFKWENRELRIIGRPQRGFRRRIFSDRNAVDPHWASDVLDLLLAQILEDKGQSVAHVIINRIRDEYPAGIGQGFDPRRDIDVVAINVVALDDDIAKVDPDPTRAARRSGQPSCAPP